MAFRTSELMVIIRGQNYLSNDLRRASASLRAFGDSAVAANTNVERVQRQIAKNTEKANALQRQMTAASGGNLLSRNVLAAQQEQRRLGFQSQRTGLLRREEQIQAQLLRGEATKLDLEKKLAAISGRGGFFINTTKGVAQLTASQTPEIAQAAKRLLANRTDLERIRLILAGMPEQWAAITAAENVANEAYAKQLGALDAGSAKIQVQRDLLRDQLLELQKLNTEELRRAELLDREEATMARLSRIQNAARTVAAVGRSAQFIGLVGTAALGATAISYAHFTSETTLAATQMANIAKKGFGDVQVKAELLNKTIEQLMTEFPATAKDMAGAAYTIFSSIPGLTTSGSTGIQKGLALLKEANRAAVAGGTDLATATDILVRTMNNFGGAGQSVNQILNRLFAIVRFGNLRFGEMQNIMNTITASALNAHQSLTDLSGAIVTLSLHTSSPRLAVGLARLLQIFQRGSFLAGLKTLGVTITDTSGKLLPLVTIMDRLTAAFPALQRGGVTAANFFKEITAAGGKGTGQSGTQGTIQALNTLTLLATHMKELHQSQSLVTKDNQEFARSYDALNQTAGVKWSIFTNMLRVTALKVGETVIPVFTRIGHRIGEMIHWFDNLSPHTRKMIGSFAAWGGIALLVGGTLLHLVGNLISFGLTIFKVLGPLGKFMKYLAALRLLGPIAVTIVISYVVAKAAHRFSKWLGGTAFGKFVGAGDRLPSQSDLYKLPPSMIDQLARAGMISSDMAQKALAYQSRNLYHLSGPQGITAAKKKAIDPLEKFLNDPKAFLNQAASLKKYQDNLAGLLNGTNSLLKKQAALAGQEANAVVAAQQKMADKITTMVQRLQSVFEQFYEANKTMFGGLFQGRTMQGPIGQVYSQLAQYNIAPPYKFLLQDLQSQNQDFESYRKSISALKKKGAPQAFIDELMATGPGGRLAVQTLSQGTKRQIAAYINEWKRGHGAIQKATSIDYDTQLREWQSYGKKTMLAILTGMKSQTGVLKHGFTKYVLDATLADSMRAWINREFPDLIKQAGQAAARKFEERHKARTAAQNKVLGSGPSTVVHSKVEHHHHQNVYAMAGGSLGAALRQARFEYEVGIKRIMGNPAMIGGANPAAAIGGPNGPSGPGGSGNYSGPKSGAW